MEVKVAMISFVWYMIALVCAVVIAGVGMDFSSSFTALFLVLFLVLVVLGKLCSYYGKERDSRVAAKDILYAEACSSRVNNQRFENGAGVKVRITMPVWKSVLTFVRVVMALCFVLWRLRKRLSSKLQVFRRYRN